MRCLAIFPILDEDDPASVCARALAAAAHAQASLAVFNAVRVDPGDARIATASRCTSATSCTAISAARPARLHGHRPAVNLASRIEGLCRDLGRPVLLSAGFVAASGGGAEPLGAFSLKGLAEPQQIYAPAVAAA